MLTFSFIFHIHYLVAVFQPLIKLLLTYLLTYVNNTSKGYFAVCLLVYWYCNLTLFVRWNNVVTGGFGMKNGVRQGGILSPFLFRSVLRMLFLKLTLSIGYG